MKYLLPALVAGGVGLVVLHGLHQHKNYRHKTPFPRMRVRSAPVAISTTVNHLKRQCNEYMVHAAVDGHEAIAKHDMIEPLLHEHCHRKLPHMITGGASREEIQQHCIGICEQVAQECNLHLKPRCYPHMLHHTTSGIHPGIIGSPHHGGGMMELPRYHAHALQVNAFDLDYNHTPTPNAGGRLF
jgi:hypothetical protein